MMVVMVVKEERRTDRLCILVLEQARLDSQTYGT